MEVILAAILFILLSPGMVFTLPPGPGGLFEGSSTSNIAILVHAVLFYIVQKLVQKNTFPFGYLNDLVDEISTKNQMVAGSPTSAPILATILFILLSPGLLLTLPPDQGGLIMSKDTNVLAIFVHGVIYFILLKLYANNLDKDAVKWINDQLESI
jgi:hypothetical protein